ncbi:DUF4355 domain-containing protein [Alkalihalobacillus sp. LMS6]|jgi:NCAIR mutase (PurE)-related protein|uniref:phage scaffolding protein n=1 Tax=Alkalihalobacillus sp. LMS6 TaxID=2924034 RepID=UPI0020D00359|nr:DUF4355 domain-containing protein [Alkalihalobacillus sp. LMS6]UTR05151.1 DUF4355 domain-containing protein [Alkalihalobacillus sp. LMS6]
MAIEETEQIEATEAQAKVNDETTVEEPENKPETKTFTQEEVNAMIADRLGREKKKYADYDDVKAKASEFEKQAEERRLAEMSEKEKAEELAKKYESEREELAGQLEAFKKQVEQEKVKNAFITKAQAAGISYIDDAHALADLSAVQVTDEGVAGIDEVISALIENKPFLVAQPKVEQKQIGGPSNHGAPSEVKTLEAQLDEAKKSKNMSKVIELSNKIKQFTRGN